MPNLSRESVQTLRQKGYKVRVKHYRYSLWGGRLTSKHTKLLPIKDLEGKIRHPKGGLTIIELDGPQGRFVGFDFFSLAKKVVDFFS